MVRPVQETFIAKVLGLPSTYSRVFAGLSTDEKPKDGVLTGNMFIEVNTGDIYAYDETGSGTWYLFCSLGGGN